MAGDRGDLLSDGRNQPIAIARAVVKTHSSSRSRPKRPSTGRIANFFASLRDLHHLGPSAVAKGKERAGASSIIIGGTGNSPSMAVAGASSLLPTDDFADRLLAAMERMSVALAGAEADTAATSDVDAAVVAFSENLLTTTQVSSPVILLALLDIYRLKSRHPELHGQEGSDYRLSVTSLMLANKVAEVTFGLTICASLPAVLTVVGRPPIPQQDMERALGNLLGLTAAAAAAAAPRPGAQARLSPHPPQPACAFQMTNILQQLQRDPSPGANDKRAQRCSGVALSVAMLGLTVAPTANVPRPDAQTSFSNTGARVRRSVTPGPGLSSRAHPLSP
ncbi:hypothetical protein V8E36_009302 [Tilletia maclaganii]